eukprot:832317-Pelagomonas_calceolata.AAC.2
MDGRVDGAGRSSSRPMASMSSEKLPCSSASEPSASPSLDRAAFRPAPDVAAPVVGAGRRRRSWLCQGVPDGGAVGALSALGSPTLRPPPAKAWTGCLRQRCALGGGAAWRGGLAWWGACPDPAVQHAGRVPHVVATGSYCRRVAVLQGQCPDPAAQHAGRVPHVVATGPNYRQVALLQGQCPDPASQHAGRVPRGGDADVMEGMPGSRHTRQGATRKSQ